MQQHSIFDGGMAPELKQELAGAAKWGRVTAIVGLVGAGLSLIAGIAAGSLLGSLLSVVLAVVMNIFLLRFGNHSNTAIQSNDQGSLIEGMEALRTYFKIMAIIILIVCVLVGIIILGSVFIGLMGSR